MKLQFDFIKDSKQGVIELDVFTRILKGEFYDDEEVRIERPGSYILGEEYVGLAKAGSSVFDPVWNCARCVWVNGKKTRMQFRSNIVWEDRITGWS